jgi:hypothetical protein
MISLIVCKRNSGPAEVQSFTMVVSNLAAPSTTHRTQLVTLSVPTDFRLPDLEDLGGASAVATRPGELLLVTRLWDSHDLVSEGLP